MAAAPLAPPDPEPEAPAGEEDPTMTASEVFGKALLEIAEQGRATPCQGRRRDRWTSDHVEERAWAASVCVTLACEVLLQCRAAADEHDEKHGVWGDRDRTPASQRKYAVTTQGTER